MGELADGVGLPQGVGDAPHDQVQVAGDDGGVGSALLGLHGYLQ
jgi:hypothetical protein